MWRVCYFVGGQADPNRYIVVVSHSNTELLMYLYNPDSNLYYLVTAAIEIDTGLVTLTVSQDGVATNPGYVPAAGEVLCPIEFYLTLFNIPEASIDGNRYMLIAQAVSRYVERYTNNSWTDITVPEDLMGTVANMIRDQFANADTFKDPRLQSESVKNYSYTLVAQGPGPASTYAKYIDTLNMFRLTAFA